MQRLLVSLALLLSILTGLSSESRAASYGSFTDPTGTVQYLNVQDVNGLFGSPSVSLNSLDFTPVGFQAQCTQCPGGVETSDILTLDIQAVAGQQLDRIRVSEGLDYSVLSFDSTGFASATVSATIFIDIVQVDGINVNGINHSVQVDYTPGPSANVFGIGTSIGVIVGDTEIDIRQVLANAGVQGEATRVRVSLDNTLTAFHDGSGGQATIRKRDADLVSLTVVGITGTPEPSTAVLILGGLALLSRHRPAR